MPKIDDAKIPVGHGQRQSTSDIALNLQVAKNASFPRERVIHRGVEALTDAELVALILRTGDGRRHVVEFAQQLLVQLGGLRKLLDASEDYLLGIRGLGPAKVAALKSARALSNRYLRAGCERSGVFNSSSSVRPYVQSKLCARHQEVFAVLLLDSQNRLISYQELFFGTIDSASIHPREVLRCVIEQNAAAIIFAHNHPSGVAEPSQDDIKVTKKLKLLLGEVGVRVLDHLVVGSEEITSFADRGLL